MVSRQRGSVLLVARDGCTIWFIAALRRCFDHAPVTLAAGSRAVRFKEKRRVPLGVISSGENQSPRRAHQRPK